MLLLEVIEIGLERPGTTLQSVYLLLQSGPISIFGLQQLSQIQNLRRLSRVVFKDSLHSLKECTVLTFLLCIKSYRRRAKETNGAADLCK